MTANSNIYIALATLAYFVLYLCISALNVRHTRIHQYKNEDDIEVRSKEERDSE